ncbi:hypothetical protein PENSPDRAFT_605183 [Peniophora sp. CONT]|nr:hypothetical protein PENSPDRAFT_605183 [Peniophora sp. CONT]
MNNFEWSDEYDVLLEKIADTDVVETEWPKLKCIIRHKVEKNVETFLADTEELRKAYIVPTSFLNGGMQPNGGLRLPPFQTTRRDEPGPVDPPKHFLTAEEAASNQSMLFEQLDTFDGAPFSIQRIAELCLRPRVNYSAPGKYLRALERVFFVTSTHSSFPPLPPAPPTGTISLGPTPFSSDSTPSTPLFSPIPFLHRPTSAPPSPLVLGSDPASSAPIPPVDMGTPALGLVDEMDDPGPGHLSDRPTALSSTTSVSDEPGPMSLEARFVRGADEEKEGEPAAKKPRTDEGSAEGAVEAKMETEASDERDGDKENKT